MGARAVAGVFDTVGAAEQARRQLLASGVDGDRINVSSSPWEDAVAGEAPGQSYENQPGQGERRGWRGLFLDASARERASARHGEAVRSGACVVSVDAVSRQEQKDIAQLMHRNGARRISEHLE